MGVPELSDVHDTVPNVKQTEVPVGDNEAARDAFLAFRNADMELWRRASTTLGLSLLATRVLARIIRSGERGTLLRQVDLSRTLQISPAGLSQIIDVLEERDLVRRTPHATDGRAHGIEPGEAAAPIAQVLLDYYTEFNRLTAAMPQDQLDAFTRVMRGMEVASAAPFTG